MGWGAEQKAPVSLTWESEESADSQVLGLAAVDLPERREPQNGTLGSLADPQMCSKWGWEGPGRRAAAGKQSAKQGSVALRGRGTALNDSYV